MHISHDNRKWFNQHQLHNHQYHHNHNHHQYHHNHHQYYQYHQIIIIIIINIIKSLSSNHYQIITHYHYYYYYQLSIYSYQGIRKSVGVILPPAPLRFDLTTKEIMEVIEGTAYVSINGENEKTFTNGESWTVEAGGYFIVRVDSALHYVCHFEGI